eukprot:2703747-Rhodomonas_salina.1
MKAASLLRCVEDTAQNTLPLPPPALLHSHSPLRLTIRSRTLTAFSSLLPPPYSLLPTASPSSLQPSRTPSVTSPPCTLPALPPPPLAPPNPHALFLILSLFPGQSTFLPGGVPQDQQPQSPGHGIPHVSTGSHITNE